MATTFQIVQGRYVSDLAWGLHSAGALQQLTRWHTLKQLAAKHSWDKEVLATILAFLDKTTDLFDTDTRGRYRIRAGYRSYVRLGFYLDFFIGAYGGVLSAGDGVRGFRGRGSPDAATLARAFAGIADAGGEAATVKIVRSMGIRCLLDIGSGPGTLLRRLAQKDRNFFGWGIEQSGAMCRSARAQFEKAGVGQRVSIIRGDVRKVARLLSAKRRRQVESVHAGGLFNSFFRSGTRPVVAFIRQLVDLFPGRVLLVDDYYSKVRDPTAAEADYRLTFLHDVTQALSGQGLPPQHLSEWERIYSSAGARLIRSYEGNLRGLAWFHHVVQL